MKNKLFQRYALIWLIMLALFNVAVFAVPAEIAGIPRRTGSFWTGYVFITAAFLGQLACAWAALRADSAKQMFYGMPLLTVSYTGLILMLIVGILFMLVPFLPVWLGVILCFAVLAFTAVSVIKAETAAEAVQQTEARVRTRTFAVRDLTARADALINRAETENGKAECQRVFEALRYSDPVSDPSLSDTESEISGKLEEMKGLLSAADELKLKETADEILILIESRNRKCRLLK